MNIRYLLGVLAVLGIAFLGVFLASPSIGVVQADEFVLLDGYSGEFASSDASHSFTYYHIDIPEGKDVSVDVPNSFISIDGHFYFTQNGTITYNAPLGSPDMWANRKLIHLDAEDSKYEFLVAYLKDGSIDFSKSILAIVPKAYFSGRPIAIEPPPTPSGNPLTWKEQKPDEDLTNIPEPKNPTTGYAAEVCFNPGLEGLPQTGLCDYLVISTYRQLLEVESSDVLKIKEFLSYLFEGVKKTTPMESFDDPRFATPDDGDVNPVIVYDPDNVIEEIDGKVVEKKTTSDNTTNESTISSPNESDAKNSEESSVENIQASNGSGTPILFSVLPPKKADLVTRGGKISLQSSTTLFYEDFEGAFPSGNWSVSDVDSGSGLDYWDDTSISSHYGSWSAWAAQNGSQWGSVAYDAFSSLSGWSTNDQNPTGGDDVWVYSSNRYTSSPGSAKTTSGNYDVYMTSLLKKNTSYNASSWGAGNVRLHFWVWHDTTSPNDKVSVIFSGNGSTYTPVCTYSGSSSGWQEKYCTVPSQYLTSQFKYGFLFESDSSPESKEGAYIDDVYLERYANNSVFVKYDDNQESRLQYGPISVSGYTNTMFEFWIKGNIEECCDNAYVELSANGTSWTPTGSIIQTSYGSWQNKQYNFSSLSGNIYFRIIFDSDDSIRDSGYYVDDVKVWGYALLPNGSPCSSASQCQTGVCGGAHTEYRIHCNADGSSNAFGDERIFENTCGGAGQLYQTNPDAASGSCISTKVCDSDLQYYNSTFTTSQICKTSIPNVCSVSPDCWNDNGGVDCKGSSSKICTYGNNGDYCTENAQCNSNQCISNQCSTGAPNGSACTTDSTCASKFCVANVCSASHNPKTVLTDTWDAANSNGVSTNTDGHVFVNGTVYPSVTGLREETDAVCYDFDGNGVYDACYYDSNGCGGGGCAFNVCNYATPNSVTNKYACDIDSPNGCRVGIDNSTQAKICTGANCLVDTSVGSKSRQISVKRYTDCDNSSLIKSEDTVVPSAAGEDTYTVYHSKYYKAWDASSNQSNYDVVAQFGYSDTNSNELFSYQCQPTSVKAVDVVAEEFRVTTPNGVIPDVCKKVPGQACTSNSECLYNICSGNQCQLSGGIKGHLTDETGHPIAGKVMKLTTCNNTLVAQSTTDASGKYSFYAPAGSYKQKTTAPWGEVTFVWAGEPSGCHSFGTGFNVVSTWLYTRANIRGRAIDPEGFPSVGLPFEAATCQNVVLDTDTSNSQGNFDLSTDTGYQKVNVTLNGNKFPITTQNGNACIFQYGEVNLGDIEVTANCSLYNNTCSNEDPDYRLYNCSSSSVNGCGCSIQYCQAGCTSGAPACNVVGSGTIKVLVSDVNGNPIPYAEVRVDGALKGKTNAFGKKDINAQHGSYTVKATCPNDPLSQTKNAPIYANQKYVSFVLNCPTPPMGDLKVIVNDANGLPIMNAHIYLDESQTPLGVTDFFGLTSIPNINFGNHSVQFVYRLDFNGTTLQTSKIVDINSSVTTVVQTLYAPNQQGSSNLTITEVQPTLFGIDDTVAVGTIVLATVAARADYCACVDGYSDVPIFNECMTTFGSSNTTSDLEYGISPLRNFVLDHYNEHQYCESHFMGTIKKIGEFVAIDYGFGMVLGGLGSIYRVVDKVVPVSKTVAGLVDEANQILLLRNSVTTVEYAKPTVEIAFNKLSSSLKPYTIRGISDLSYEGKVAMEIVIQKMGASGGNYIEQAVQSGFSKEYIAEVFNRLGRLKNHPNVSQQVIVSLEDDLAHHLKNGNPGNIQGILGEAWGSADEEFFLNTGLKFHDVEPVGVPAGGSKTDFVLNNNELLEIKTTNMEQLYHTTTYWSRISDIINKAQQWQAADPTRLIHVKFNTHFSSITETNIYNDLVTKIQESGATVNISKIILHWS